MPEKVKSIARAGTTSIEASAENKLFSKTPKVELRSIKVGIYLHSTESYYRVLPALNEDVPTPQ
jgi:hypothetical protein